MREDTHQRFSQIIRIRNNPSRPDAGTPAQYHDSILKTLQDFQQLRPTEYKKPPVALGIMLRALTILAVTLVTTVALIALPMTPLFAEHPVPRLVLTVSVWFIMAGFMSSWREWHELIAPSRPWVFRRTLILTVFAVLAGVAVAGTVPPSLWKPHAKELLVVAGVSTVWLGVISGRGSGWQLHDAEGG